jgi:hypothetical protein
VRGDADEGASQLAPDTLVPRVPATHLLHHLGGARDAVAVDQPLGEDAEQGPRPEPASVPVLGSVLQRAKLSRGE